MVRGMETWFAHAGGSKKNGKSLRANATVLQLQSVTGPRLMFASSGLLLVTFGSFGAFCGTQRQNYRCSGSDLTIRIWTCGTRDPGHKARCSALQTLADHEQSSETLQPAAENKHTGIKTSACITDYAQ